MPLVKPKAPGLSTQGPWLLLLQRRLRLYAFTFFAILATVLAKVVI